MAGETGSTGGGGWLQAAMAGLTTVANAVSRGGPKRQWKYNKKAMEFANAQNRENAQWAYDKNMELVKYQQDYDSPAQQMARYRAAGLNENLIYGQGTPGNMGSPMVQPQLPPARMDAPDASYGPVGSEFMGNMLAQSQMGLVQAKTVESQGKAGVLDAQERLINANPHLNPSYINALVTNLESIAAIKAQEAKFLTSEQKYSGTSTRGEQKMILEIEQLAQKIGLNTQDLQIKAKIIQSKELENALKEIQKKWLEDGDITPQHIYQGIMMLLSKMM